MTRWAFRRVGAVVSLAVVLASGTARAGDPASAEALFREGRDRLAAHDVAAACAKFAESERLDAMPGTLLNLAACHAAEGRVATAWAEFVSAGQLASVRGDAAQADEAQRRADELAPRLPRLTIVMDASPSFATVQRDDVELAPASLGSPLPVDPGAHRIVARAPGYEPFTVDVDVKEGEAREVRVPPLSPKVRPASPPRKSPIVLRETPYPRVPSDARDARLGWVIGGAGLALAATSGTLLALAISANHNAERGCPYRGNFACTDTALAAGRERDTLSTIATVSGSLGVAGIAAGLWFLLHPSASEAPPGKARTGVLEPTVIPELSPRGSTVFLRESFE